MVSPGQAALMAAWMLVKLHPEAQTVRTLGTAVQITIWLVKFM